VQKATPALTPDEQTFALAVANLLSAIIGRSSASVGGLRQAQLEAIASWRVEWRTTSTTS
jgi:hypothetical protein